MLTNSSGMNYVFNEHKDIALRSSTGSNYILNEHEDLTILTNMAICNTIPDKWIQMESLWSYQVNELIWHWLFSQTSMKVDQNDAYLDLLNKLSLKMEIDWVMWYPVGHNYDTRFCDKYQFC